MVTESGYGDGGQALGGPPTGQVGRSCRRRRPNQDLGEPHILPAAPVGYPQPYRLRGPLQSGPPLSAGDNQRGYYKVVKLTAKGSARLTT